MKKLIFTYVVIACALLSSCNNPNRQITYSSHYQGITLGNLGDWGAKIKSHEFKNGLGIITFDKEITIIPKNAFANCYNLRSISLPSTVEEIKESAFVNCKALVDITLPSQLQFIGIDAFKYCENLNNLKIPKSVKTIEEGAFQHCKFLHRITIPESITSIAEGLFYGCDNLKKITIPDSVTTIGEDAFYFCDKLESVYCKAKTPPSGGPHMFYFNGWNRKIYVPHNAVEAYKSAEYWKDYADDIVGYDF